MSIVQSCAFCTLPPERIVNFNNSAMVVRDGFPVSNGHTLIISRRHVGLLRDLDEAERADLFGLLLQAQLQLTAEFSPDAFNIGINDGAAAGQTVPHLHIHLIPRYKGDLPDPRGGVRWVLPHNANYWS